MKHGAKNKIVAEVESIQKGDVMSLVKMKVHAPTEMSSVMTTESLEHLRCAIDLCDDAVFVSQEYRSLTATNQTN